MTTINVLSFLTTIGDPGQVPHETVVAFTPWAGDGPAARLEGPGVVIPDGVRVMLEDGTPSEPIVVEPSDSMFCWRATVASDAPAFKLTRYVSVPNLASIDFEDLIDVDPTTFSPTPTAIAAWGSALTSPMGTVSAVEAMTQAQFDGITPSPEQITFIIE